VNGPGVLHPYVLHSVRLYARAYRAAERNTILAQEAQLHNIAVLREPVEAWQVCVDHESAPTEIV